MMQMKRTIYFGQKHKSDDIKIWFFFFLLLTEIFLCLTAYYWKLTETFVG